MTQDPDRLFRRYQQERDPELLARVFDVTAPRLLRLAVHLVGDAAEAEDLVQATFLAAIERAQSFQGSGSIQGWLTGILSNKAKDVHRRGTRELDAERLLGDEAPRAVVTPLEEALEAESSGALAKAIDDLDDTYRRPLMLRLRHGMKTADIAHVLDLSPGAVRVRLSRGTEKLRQSLPVGLASVALLLATPERGLAAVREVVVAEATRAAVLVTGTSTFTLGGLLMTKKVLLASVALLVALAGGAWWRSSTAPSQPAPAPVPIFEAARGGGAPAEDLQPAIPAPAPQEERVAVEQDSAPGTAMAGRVIDGATGDPLEGALLQVFPAEELTYSQLKKREFPYVRQQNWGGEIRAFATWPRFEENLTEAERLDAEPLLAWTRPAPGIRPQATTTSDGNGKFQLPLPTLGATFVVELAGYGRRCIPLSPVDVDALDAEAGLVVAMRTPGRLTGLVIDTEGRPVEEELQLVFWGTLQEHQANEQGEYVEQTSEAWLATTAPDGSFDVELPCGQAYAHVSTPGYLVRQTGFHPDHERRWVFDQQFEPGQPNACPMGEDHPPYIVVERVPVLHVTDSTSGEVIEHFQMVGRELANGYARWAGHYFAPEGLYSLVNEEHWIRELAEKPFELVIWSADHREARLRLSAEVLEQSIIDVQLEPGDLPELRGRVLEGGQPCRGAVVALQPYGKLQWSLEGGRAVAVVNTDASGSFALRAPAGDYVLRIEYGAHVFAEPLTLPEDAERLIDFGRLGQVLVEIRDESGTLQTDHTAVLRDGSGRSHWQSTDERGETVFEHLPEATYQVIVPKVSTKGSFGGGIIEEVEVRGAGVERLVVTIPTLGGPRHARVVTDIGEDLQGWRANSSGLEEPVPIEADGTIPIDIGRQNFRRLIVMAPDGRHWEATLPEDAPDGHEIHVTLNGPRYEGVLVDYATGAPIRNVRVRAFPVRPGGFDGASPVEPSAKTDDEGRFVIPCAHELPHTLRFNSWYEGANPLEGVAFRLERAPARHPVELALRVPQRSDGAFQGLATKLLRGVVRRRHSGEPVAEARIWVFSREAQPDGMLEVWGGTTMTTDAQGAYELSVADLASYSLNVYPPDSNSSAVTEEWNGTPGADEERDLTIP